MRNPIDIMYILKEIGEKHFRIKTVREGDYVQILGGQLSKNEYPLLWVESPEIQLTGSNDSIVPVGEVAFVVLINSTPDNYEKQKMNQGIAYDITMDVIYKLMEISEVDIRDVRINYLPHSDADNSQGYRVQMKIEMEDHCDDIDSRFSTQITGNVPSFSYKVEAGGIRCKTDHQAAWKWNDGQSSGTLTGDNVLVPSSGKVVISMDDVCSIIVDGSEIGYTGSSLPMIYSIY